MRLARDAFVREGLGLSWRRGWYRVIRTVDRGTRSFRRDLGPVPPAATAVVVRDTPAGYGKPGTGAGMGGRGLSHPQDGPLTLTGALELQPGPGPCGQLGSRTANRMAVPLSPFIRERA